MKNFSMKNDGLCFAHFRQSCDCPHNENDKNVRMTFSSLAEGGVPICTHCEQEYMFMGVEIKGRKKKEFPLKVRYGTDGITPPEDRPVSEYIFSTEQDRREARSILDDFDGYLECEVADRHGKFCED